MDTTEDRLKALGVEVPSTPDKKRTPGGHWDLRTWSIVQVLYESGKYANVAELREDACRLVPGGCPSERAISSRSTREAWTWGLRANEVDNMAVAFSAISFASRGFTKDEALDVVVSGIRGSKKTGDKLRWFQEYAALVGAYAPKREAVDHTTAGQPIEGDRVGPTVILPYVDRRGAKYRGEPQE